MSKIKTKKVLTPEQKKKRIRNIIIVAVILVAAAVATYWMQPQNKARRPQAWATRRSS